LLARRNRGLPELLLGVSLIAGGSIGAVLEAAGMTATTELAPAIAGRLLMIGKIFGLIGIACQLTFIRIVFRPTARWAHGCVVAICLINAFVFVAFGLQGTYTTAVIPISIFSVELVARVGASLWLVAESVRYYNLMKKRVALGLSDPLVADRFRIWAAAGLAGVIMLATSVPPVVVEDKATPWLVWDIVVFSFSGIMTSSLYLLAFFPPNAYRRYVTRRAASAD
jgi:hypothetical protein